MDTRGYEHARGGDTADLLEMRRAYRAGDLARAAEIEARSDMVQYAPGQYVNRSVLGERGYEAETRGAREHEARDLDRAHERDLELAIETYKSILGESA